jgi:hypothetical protein
MTEHQRLAPTLEAELSAEDAAWLRRQGWNDAALPPIASARDAERYARIEAAIGKAMKGSSFAERGESAEGRMAAALGAHLANWRERDEAAEGED